MGGETVEDILAEIRGAAFGFDDFKRVQFTFGELRSFIRRISTAAKCEREEAEMAGLAAGGMVAAARHKPKRNCDRFHGDKDKLIEACLNERGMNPEENFPDIFIDWLLAPSTSYEDRMRGWLGLSDRKEI